MAGGCWQCDVEISKFGVLRKDDHGISSVTCRKESQALVSILFQVMQNACDGKTRCNNDVRVQRISAAECGNSITDYAVIQYNCIADGKCLPSVPRYLLMYRWPSWKWESNLRIVIRNYQWPKLFGLNISTVVATIVFADCLAPLSARTSSGTHLW